jgi:hypothetical protein
MVKLDIEGFELEALEGALDLLHSEHPPMLMVECSEMRENTFGGGPGPLYEFLRQLGRYRIFRGKKEKSRLSPLVEVKTLQEMPVHDNIYCLAGKHLERLNA